MQSVRPSYVLATIMWALFIFLGLGMTLGYVAFTWFGFGFTMLCFIVAGLVSLSGSGRRYPER